VTSTTTRLLGGRWLLKEAVGDQGGMSEVFRAFDTDGAHNVVAAKLLPLHLQRDEWKLKAFELEWQARHAPLDHPHIVPLLDRGREEGSDIPYLIFPWAGTSLSRLLAGQDPVAWDDWWERYGRPTLDALTHVHLRDVAHRDVKPDNVLVDEDGIPRIADFGLAKLLGPLTTGLTMRQHGSPPFSPREPDVGVHSCTRDLHAWAAMTYFAVGGHDPAEANHADDPYTVLDAAADAGRLLLPQVVAEWLDRCLAEPQDRPRMAAELLAGLDQACGTGPAERPVPRGALRVRVSERIEGLLERDRDLSSADVRDLLRTTLHEAVVVVLPGASEQYRIVGHQLTLRVKAHQDERSLVVVGHSHPPADVVERDRARGWLPTVTLTADAASVDDGLDAMSTFSHGVAEHAEEASRRGREAARRQTLYRWRDVLALLREAQDEEADPLEYDDVRRARSGALVFTMRRPASPLLGGQQRTAPTSGGVIACEIRNVARDQIVAVPLDTTARDVRSEGELKLDTRRAQVALKRQDRALDAVLYRQTVREDLVELMTEPGRSSTPRPIRDPIPKQPLDDHKRAALKIALGEPDLMVVKGPPGTGKTRFIAELVYQTLVKNPSARVLVACQTHAGLDNALVRIKELDPTFDVLRIAHPDDPKVDATVDELRIDAVLEQWGERAAVSGDAWLAAWAKQRDVDLEAVRQSTALDAVADAVDLVRALVADAEQLVRSGTGARDAPGRLRRADLLDDLKIARLEAEARARGRLSEAVELGVMPRTVRQGQVDPAAARDRASQLAPRDADHDRCRELIDLLSTWHARFGGSPEFNVAALTRAQVVGGTCVGLGGLRGFNEVSFDLCVIDEASRATAPELFIPMSRARRVVLVGDEQQLPPYLDRDVLTDDRLAARNLTFEEIRAPFFSFLADHLPADNVVGLREQHRMHPAIGALVSDCFYRGELESARDDEPLPVHLRSVASRPVLWRTTAKLPERYEARSGRSFINEVETACIADLLQQLAMASATHEVRTEVVVLAAYKAQCRLLEQRLAPLIADDASIAVSVHTVDGFQGREADVVIYSVTRSNAPGNLGFTRERPRVNVALSRARELLVVVGDHRAASTRTGENPFRDVLAHVNAHHRECEMQEVRG
jgi:hypothetical protein